MASSASGMHEHFELLSGRDLHRILGTGLARLESAVEEINAINVFPVPDRDTGTNMFETLRYTLSSMEPSEEESLGSVASRISDRALYGARGNSGVLLAEFLRGFTRELAVGEHLDARRLIRALRRGAIAARAAVRAVVEGTILTVMNDAALAAEHAGELAADLAGVLRAAAGAARESLQSTPRLLPALRESSVVDAGAAGFVAILEGMMIALGAVAPPMADLADLTEWQGPRRATNAGAAAGRADARSPTTYGYCTELLVQNEAARLDEDRLVERLSSLGESLLVIGTKRLLRVHIHASDPGAVLSECLKHGSIEEITIHNIDTRASSHGNGAADEGQPPDRVGVVAVADGRGFAEIFRSLGAAVVEITDHDDHRVGAELLDCIGTLPHRTIIVLPNHRDALGGVRDIVDWKGKQVRSVETATMTAGVAALVELDPEASIEDNLQRMNAAAAEVQTVAIDREQGQYLLALGDSPLGRSADLSGLVQAVVGALPGDFDLATLYYSEAAEKEQIDEVAEVFRRCVARVELHFGGQASPLYLISLE